MNDADAAALSSSDGSAEFDERRVSEYLESRRDAMVKEFGKLIACMRASGTTRVLLANAHDANLRLAIVERDTPKSAGASGLGIDVVDAGEAGFERPIWADQAHPFLSECWLAAGGGDTSDSASKANVSCVVHEDGIDVLCDLRTGEEPV
jgi:hypothetical protein